jgi:hypothetical protein
MSAFLLPLWFAWRLSNQVEKGSRVVVVLAVSSPIQKTKIDAQASVFTLQPEFSSSGTPSIAVQKGIL